MMKDYSLYCAKLKASSMGQLSPQNPNDPNDLESLTPNHLLLLKTQPSMPHGIFIKDDVYARWHWRQVQYIVDLFWKILTQEYLPLLQEQQKWIGLKRSLKIGDIVLVVDPSLPRNSWILVMPDSKGIVRSAKITNITKLCLLQREE